MHFTASPGQTVFAHWRNGYYYPAVVTEVLGDHIKVSVLADGVVAQIEREYIIELQAAFDTMHFQGNWQHEGIFYRGKLASHLPLIMHYNDGDVEQLELSQLRGKRLESEKKPKKKPAREPKKERHTEPVLIQSEKEAIKELKMLRRTGRISKEEYKRLREQLR